MTAVPASPAAPQQAAVDAALLVLKSMGLSPEDLTAAPGQRLAVVARKPDEPHRLPPSFPPARHFAGVAGLGRSVAYR